jgi:hypothetical protein
MSTLDDINSERDAAVKTLNRKLLAAADLKNAGAVGMDNTINALATHRAEVAAQAYAAALDDPTMIRALAALKAATAEMNTVAARMVSATTFLSNVASLGTATNKVVSALRGNG